jgi:hypothetical protein
MAPQEWPTISIIPQVLRAARIPAVLMSELRIPTVEMNLDKWHVALSG